MHKYPRTYGNVVAKSATIKEVGRWTRNKWE